VLRILTICVERGRDRKEDREVGDKEREVGSGKWEAGSRKQEVRRGRREDILIKLPIEKLQAIASASRKGMLMDVDDRDGVGSAIGKAFEEIGSMMDAGVETYNFRTDE
jgi:hypothetical protein